MLKIRWYYGNWKECTREQAKELYLLFIESATVVRSMDKRSIFNKAHIHGGYISIHGEVTEDGNNK